MLRFSRLLHRALLPRKLKRADFQLHRKIGTSPRVRPFLFPLLTAVKRLPVTSCRFQTQRLCSSAFTADIMPEKKSFERLPKEVVPVNYVLQLQPDLDTFTFEGQEEISLEVRSTFVKIRMTS